MPSRRSCLSFARRLRTWFACWSAFVRLSGERVEATDTAKRTSLAGFLIRNRGSRAWFCSRRSSNNPTPARPLLLPPGVRTGIGLFTDNVDEPSGPGTEETLFRYRLHSPDGDDLGEATYAVIVKPDEEIIAGNNQHFRVLDVAPFERRTSRHSWAATRRDCLNDLHSDDARAGDDPCASGAEPSG